MSTKKNSFIKEFEEFINQGSVMDLAVGMVIGSAFSKIVSSLVSDVIMPVVGILIGGIDFSDLVLTVPNFFGGNTAAHVNYGLFIQNVVDFVVIALSLFMVVRFLNKMRKRADKAKAEAAKKIADKKKAAKK